MNTFTPTNIWIQRQYFRLCVMCLAIVIISGCSALLPAPLPQPFYYSLDAMASQTPLFSNTSTPISTKPTILINNPHAAAGYDTRHIIYTRQAHKLEYYSQSEWVESPAHMLVPLISRAIERSGVFSAVVLAPTNITADFRLDSDIVRLHQAFDSGPSKVFFTLRVYIISNVTRKVIAVREFDEIAVSKTDNPYGGVIAANQVVQTTLEKLTAFCNEKDVQAKLRLAILKD